MKVLLVDDEEDLLDQAKIFLEEMGYDFDIDTVKSVDDAIKKLNNNDYDGIVSDYQMPMKNGLEFLKIVREEMSKDIPFVIFTGKGREEVAIRALNLGADRYIQKGGAPKSQYNVLAEAINQEVKRHQVEKKLELTQNSMEKASTSIYWIRPDGSFVYTNDKVREKLGYTSEKLKDMYVWDVDSEYDKNTREEWWENLKEKKVVNLKSKHKTKDGKVFPVEITSHYIEHEGEEYEFAFSRDIRDKEGTREELKKSEKRYRSIFELASEGIVLLSKDGKIRECNDAYVDMIGYDKEEIIGKTPTDFSPKTQRDGEESSEKVKKHIKKTLKGDTPNFEWTFKTKDGSKLFAEISLKKLEINDEIRIIAMKHDITEKIEAEKEINKEKKKFQEIFNNANDAIYLHELTEKGMPGNFIEVNDVACDMLGYSRDEFMKMSPRDIDAEEKMNEVLDVMDELMEKGDLRFEMVHEAKDGSKIPVEIHSHLFEYEGEQRVLSIARNISERKQAEKELKRSERRFRKSFEALPDPAFLLDDNGYFKDMNEAAVETLGYEEEEITEKHISDTPFLMKKSRDKAVNAFKRRKKGEDVSPYELELISKGGETLFSQINVGSFEEDGFHGEIVIARDITEEKRSEKKLKDTQQRLELALEGAELGVWDWNIETGEAKFNERWAEILGFDLEEVEQSVDFWDERVHP
ncbi:MAG: PAS domain S-box protein, partial [Thermoplasmatota archaeon]